MEGLRQLTNKTIDTKKQQQEYTIRQRWWRVKDKEHSKHDIHIKGIKQRRNGV